MRNAVQQRLKSKGNLGDNPSSGTKTCWSIIVYVVADAAYYIVAVENC